MDVTLYGIPTCGTVKKARAWLDARGVAHRWIDLREAPPDRATVEAWARAFGTRRLRNTSGGSYRALGAEKDAWDDARWIAAFAADAMLLKRPVVLVDGRPALVGFDEAAYVATFGPR